MLATIELVMGFYLQYAIQIIQCIRIAFCVAVEFWYYLNGDCCSLVRSIS